MKIGWESAGTLNADKSNAILITHYFSGTSHAFGKYAPSDAAAGYWDAIIGPGKAIDPGNISFSRPTPSSISTLMQRTL